MTDYTYNSLCERISIPINELYIFYIVRVLLKCNWSDPYQAPVNNEICPLLNCLLDIL